MVKEQNKEQISEVFNQWLNQEFLTWYQSKRTNQLICVPSSEKYKKFAPLMTDCIPDLGLLSASQCFPRWIYSKE